MERIDGNRWTFIEAVDDPYSQNIKANELGDLLNKLEWERVRNPRIVIC